MKATAYLKDSSKKMQSQDQTQAAKDAFIEAHSVLPDRKVSSFTSNNHDLQDDGKLKIEEFGSTDRQGLSHKRAGQIDLREQKKLQKLYGQDWLTSRA